MNKVTQYIDNILDYVELNEKNKNDLKTEIAFHINSKKDDYQVKGYNKDQAAESALSDFGEIKKVGKELNRAIFPFRKSFLMILASTSLLFSILISIFMYIFHDIVPYTWLLIATLTNISFFYFVKKPSKAAAYRLLLTGLLLLNFLINFYGFILMDSLMQSKLLYFSLFILFLINSFLIFSQIYMGAMFQPVSEKLQSLSNQKRKISLLTNIITGIVVLCIALIGLTGYIIFVPYSFPTIPLLLIILWLILLIFQLKSSHLENILRFLMIILALFVFVGFMYTQLVV